ncbi:glycosyltransferase [Xylanimonas allomyrinae]|uniref:Glycosyltransferase n=1 Tax=Xylanimonas allomyrinae TaxID=2509459 RepID=A0A4P6EKZ0_9MICO|nr:WecB/TagA/CpsF family glycosyltransferase [Xylanimonas allomyrinae]QAY61969.1 glycosyltransferase [Xylanimonas allomyrinae]
MTLSNAQAHVVERAVAARGDRPARITVGAVPVDLCSEPIAVTAIRERSTTDDATPPLAVVSVNLDHLHYFGSGGYLHGAFGIREGRSAPLHWLHLIDGAPIATRTEQLTGTRWPRLAGSDLIGPILRNAAADGVSVGFVGGAPETHLLLRQALAVSHPHLRIAGLWAPSRADLLDADTSHALAQEIAAADVDILVVCLGKPRQELWIDRYGALSGAKVFLAFGAVVDFLAHRVRRCPDWMARHGLEWAWRLALEPRRLARRYLVNGPGAYLAVRRTPPVEPPADR